MKITRKSTFSGIWRTRELLVTNQQMELFAEGELPIQNIFPNLSNSDREFIKTGITDEEWNTMFGVDEVIEEGEKIVEDMWKKAIPATKGNPFRCPNCNRFCSGFGDNPTSLIERDDTEFIEAPDPHYSWNELHKCMSCDTVYTVVNGS